MKIDQFEMERMQSTWENVVEMDMSESGVRPVTLREMAEMGLDLDAILNMPLGYSQSNGTIPLRESLAEIYPGATAEHIEVTNGTSEANYLLALALLREGDEVAFEVPNYMQYGGLPKSCGAQVRRFRLRIDRDWEPDWDEFDGAVNEKTRLVYISNPNNPTGSVLSEDAMRRIVRRCEATGAYLLADEVYLGAEIHCERTRELLGHERPRDRHQRPLQGLRNPGSAHRLDRGTEGCGGGVLGPARLPHHRAEQDFRCRGARGREGREPRKALRPHARHFAAQPADHARVGRRLRRFSDVPRAAGRRPVPDALPLGHAELRALRADSHQPERADRPRRSSRASRDSFASGWAANRSSSARGCGALAWNCGKRWRSEELIWAADKRGRACRAHPQTTSALRSARSSRNKDLWQRLSSWQ